MLKVLKVDRYRSSGKLIAVGLKNGHVIPLNSDLTFSEKGLYRVCRDTVLTRHHIELRWRSDQKGIATHIEESVFGMNATCRHCPLIQARYWNIELTSVHRSSSVRQRTDT